MVMTRIAFTKEDGWSTDSFPELDSDNTLICAFACPSFIQNPTPFKQLGEAFPNSCIIGCSTSGEIHQDEVQDNSISVGIVRFERTRLQTVSTTLQNTADSFAAGSYVARELYTPDLKAIFILADGLSTNGSELVRGINSILPPEVVVTGGCAGDGDRFEKTWIIDKGIPKEHMVVAVGFYGNNVLICHGSKGGWDTFGPERLVTRSSGNILYELDGKPALPLYKDYLGDLCSGLPATALLFPLAIRTEKDSEKSLVRSVLGVNEEDNSLIFKADIPQGAYAQLMRNKTDNLINSASDSAKNATMDLPKRPVFSIAISCVGRRLVLGQRTEEEIESVLEHLPEGSIQTGFYSYGEISPFSTGHCDLHNQTMTLTTILETE